MTGKISIFLVFRKYSNAVFCAQIQTKNFLFLFPCVCVVIGHMIGRTSTSSSEKPMTLRAFLTTFQSLRSLMELTLGQLP